MFQIATFLVRKTNIWSDGLMFKRHTSRLLYLLKIHTALHKKKTTFYHYNV